MRIISATFLLLLSTQASGMLRQSPRVAHALSRTALLRQPTRPLETLTLHVMRGYAIEEISNWHAYPLFEEKIQREREALTTKKLLIRIYYASLRNEKHLHSLELKVLHLLERNPIYFSKTARELKSRHDQLRQEEQKEIERVEKEFDAFETKIIELAKESRKTRISFLNLLRYH